MYYIVYVNVCVRVRVCVCIWSINIIQILLASNGYINVCLCRNSNLQHSMLVRWRRYTDLGSADGVISRELVHCLQRPMVSPSSGLI